MKQLFSLFLVFLNVTPLFTYAQHGGYPGGREGYTPQGIITGSVQDAKTNQAIEYASVILYRIKDSTMITGVVTDPKGNFRIEKIPFGMYYLSVKFLGYTSKKITKIQINPKNSETNAGIIPLDPATENLGEVTVMGQKQMIMYNLDKKVFVVDKNIASQGGTAIDIMKNIPSVQVDIEGNVSLRGSDNVTILIDGKPSQITNLDQLPADIIENVEIVTNPSARYDPDGVSGIINIVLKKKKIPGYNGMVQLNAGTGGKYSGTVNLSLTKNKLTLNVNANYRNFRMKGTNLSNEQSWSHDGSATDTTLHFLHQDQKNERNGKMANIKFGADYVINESNSISATGSYNNRNFNMDENTRYDYWNYLHNPDSSFYNTSGGKMINTGMEYSLGYKKTFEEKGHELTADFFYSQNEGSNKNQLNMQMLLPDSIRLPNLQNSNSDITGRVITLQTDYVRPIGNGGRLEAGYKLILRNTEMDYKVDTFQNNAWTNNANYTNRFLYGQQIHSLYGIYSNTLGFFSYQFGLRAEQAFTESEQKTNNQGKHPKNYFNLFPTASLKYDFSETQAVQFNYSRRVNRPDWRILNPFISSIKPYYFTTGNPDLDPEFINSYEISHSLQWLKNDLNSSIFYRQTEGMISRYVTKGIGVDEINKYSTYRNLKNGKSYGLELVYSRPITKWWKINSSYSYFKTTISGDNVNPNAQESTSWTLDFTSNLSIPKWFDFQVMVEYSSPVVSTGGGGYHMFEGAGGQGKSKESWEVDLGLKKDIWNGKGSISLRVSDLLKSENHDMVTYGTGFTIDTKQRRETQVVFLGFTYRINDYKRPKDKRNGEDQNGDEFN